MAVFQPLPVYQLDGSRFQGSNCNCASDAMLISRGTHGRKHPTAATVRKLTGDTYGGTNLRQVNTVNHSDYGLESVPRQPIDWDELMDKARNGRGFILQLRYQPIRYTRYDCSRHNYGDNHSIYINKMNLDGTLRGCDPLADGRYGRCPRGYQNYPRALLKKAAGQLDLSGLNTAAYRPLGFGKAFALMAPAGS